MNRLDIMHNRRYVANLIRISNRHKDVLRWSNNETREHRDRKYEICVALRKMQHEFYTEAIFKKDDLRADVVDADEMIIYEVVATENLASILRKDVNYPLPLRIVRADVPWTERLIL